MDHWGFHDESISNQSMLPVLSNIPPVWKCYIISTLYCCYSIIFSAFLFFPPLNCFLGGLPQRSNREFSKFQNSQKITILLYTVTAIMDKKQRKEALYNNTFLTIPFYSLLQAWSFIWHLKSFFVFFFQCQRWQTLNYFSLHPVVV